MRILALVTARGGSKRLPRKNVRLLGGRPLIAWTIQAAKGIQEIADILVSTDEPEIIEIAGREGALAPWLRPPELATDTAKSIDVALHALDWYEAAYGPVDGLMLLQPTSPFRRPETIKQAIKLFSTNRPRPVIGVSPAASHPAWCYRVEQSTLIPYVPALPAGIPHRSQDLPSAYVLNGAMYLADPVYLRQTGSFVGASAYPLLMESPAESLDIDTAHDFLVAECIAASIGKSAVI